MSWFKIEVIIAMSSYAILILLFLLGSTRAKTKAKNRKTRPSKKKISVIVPFRNEEKKLKNLVASINSLISHADEYIFVNDHSEDQSIDVFSRLNVPIELIELKSDQGKKSAISLGAEKAKFDYILTWDADVVVPPNYFDELREYQWSDLTILPVKMLGPELIPGFFAMDYQLQTQANVSLAGFARPITASGANLLFKKSVFLEVQTTREDAVIPSGDDQFLLKACREGGKEVSLLIDEAVQVETDAPSTIFSGMQQRKRWLRKTGKVGDSFATVFGLVTLLIQLSYYSFAWYQACIGDWGSTILMILIKGELDAFLATYKFQEQFNTLKVFLYQLCYPFYMMALVFGVFFGKLEWKERTISVQSK